MGLRRLITEFHGHLPAPSSDADYHIVSKYSSRRIKRAQTRWGCVVYYGVPMATFQLHHQTLILLPLVFNSETRSDAEPQPGPSKRLRTE
ncbi:hypothetical protein EVAR_40225_1 [Eumeta japonica]|uniref:Uncharacterized protein n=1 Tax=Eumeta variegata TaxID=151549 RepID=A0A4C1X7S9_EUMVA|nr:hypothetical protein EVAR_40225_1 [Eumeta japonica]